MADPLIMQEDGICRKGTPGGSNGNGAGGTPPSEQIIAIEMPVGQGFGAKNLDQDVRTIQNSLNQIKPLHGGPEVPLVVDGKCGPKTNKAIRDFQFKQFGMKGADGLIEPGKQTITRMNQLLFSATPVSPGFNDDLKKQMVSHLDLVARAVHAAQATLLRAMKPATGGIDFGEGAANDRLNRHFGLLTLSPNQRAQALRNISGVFGMYSAVLLMPGALGAGAFEADPTGDPRIAFTFANGFFMPEVVEPRKNIRVDRIYLGRRSFFALDDSEFCAFIMLHEMAHFVGFPGGSLILDNGRGWFTDETIKKLNADRRLHNADCYATFADECRTGSQNKPRYVKASTTSR